MSDGQRQYGAVVPTYHTPEMALKCIESLLMSRQPPEMIVVVDNGADDTADRIADRSWRDVTVVRSGQNDGFAKAINVGSRLLNQPMILWMNSDVIVREDDLLSLVRELDGRSELGAVAPRQITATGQELPAVHRFPSARRPFKRPRKRDDTMGLAPDEFLSGACLLVRRAAWNEVGELDDSFFFYWEEADWQFRARQAGWRIALSATTVVHAGGGSASPQSTVLRLLSSEGYERFIRKHEGLGALLMHRATNLPGVLAAALAHADRRTPGSQGCASDAEMARARLRQILRPIPAGRTSPWAAKLARRHE